MSGARATAVAAKVDLMQCDGLLVWAWLDASACAQIALVLFFLVFVSVCLKTLLSRRVVVDYQAALPLEDGLPNRVPARSTPVGAGPASNIADRDNERSGQSLIGR